MLQISVRAATPSDFQDIERLRVDAYNVRGYCSQSRVTEQCFLENQFALVAEIDGEAVGTMSVTYDRGEIPTDSVFPAETSSVRGLSKKIAYYGSFAVRVGMWRSGTNAIGQALIREAIMRTSAEGADAAIIVVNPRHVLFYQKLGLKEMARQDNMPGIEKAPAVMLAATGEDFKNLLARHEEISRAYDRKNRMRE